MVFSACSFLFFIVKYIKINLPMLLLHCLFLMQIFPHIEYFTIILQYTSFREKYIILEMIEIG
jgi:hypothetical protein